MSVNISASFSKNDKLYNGLDSIVDKLIDEPLELRTAVITYQTSFSKRDFKNGGEEIPTIRVVQIEPLADDAAEQAKSLQKAAFLARTGNPLQDDLFSLLDKLDDDETD